MKLHLYGDRFDEMISDITAGEARVRRPLFFDRLPGPPPRGDDSDGALYLVASYYTGDSIYLAWRELDGTWADYWTKRAEWVGIADREGALITRDGLADARAWCPPNEWQQQDHRAEAA